MDTRTTDHGKTDIPISTDTTPASVDDAPGAPNDVSAGHLQELVFAAASRQGVAIDDEQVRALLRHLDLVIEKNKVINLTAIRDVEEGIVKHIEDCLVGLKEVDEAKPGRFCDLGTGAGYPGIVIGIMTGRSGTLVDSVKKKVRCVEEFIDDLGLSKRLGTCDTRAEELAARNPGRFAIVTARAMSSLPSLLELSSPLLCMGGRLIAWKGDPEQSEIDAGDKAAQLVGLRFVSDRAATLGPEGATRHILVYQKVAASTIKLPRENGMAQHRPLA